MKWLRKKGFGNAADTMKDENESWPMSSWAKRRISACHHQYATNWLVARLRVNGYVVPYAELGTFNTEGVKGLR